MVKVRQIGCHTYQGCYHQYCRGTEELLQYLVAPGLFKVGAHEEQDDKEEVIGHLYVVGLNLQGYKQCRHNASPQQLSPVGQHDAR